MAVVEMSRISLVGLDSDKDYIIKRLMELGVIHIDDIDSEDSRSIPAGYAHRDGDSRDVHSVENDRDRLGSVIEFLSLSDVRKKPLFKTKRDISYTEYEDTVYSQDDIRSVVKEVELLENRLDELRNKKNRLQNQAESLNPWKSMDIPAELEKTRYTDIVKGTLPAVIDMNKLRGELYAAVPESFMEIAGRDRDQIYVLIIVYGDYRSKALGTLKRYGFSEADFKDTKGRISDRLAEIRQELKEIDEEREAVKRRASGYAGHLLQMEILYDYLMVIADRKRALFKMAATQRIFVLKGWVPSSVAQKVKEIVTGERVCAVEIVKPADDEEYPVLLKNNDVAESAEMITEMYSLPKPKEADPNAVMAPFFILFFGLMLSDAGYGLLLSSVTAIILIKFNLQARTRKFIKLMFYCGLATLFWGSLFGGWFGDAVTVLSAGSINIGPLWFNPIDNPERLLMWSLIFGVIHIYAGISVIANKILRQKKYIDAVFDGLFWYVLFTGAILAVLPYVPNVDSEWASGLTGIGTYMIAAGAVLLIVTQGRKQKNAVMKLLSGITSLYDLVGFMSDVLSYSRLLALGLATSVIATIVNQMGAMAGTDNILGLVVFVIVFIGGHTFNFLINALGAYVHSSRLQYIEFFGKFYKGGGQAFEPLRINTRYTRLKADKEEILNGKVV